MVCRRPGWPEAVDRRETGAAEDLTETERHDGRGVGGRQRQGGQICLNWRFFWCIGERSGRAERREKLQSGIKRAFTARFLFPEEKIKAGNVFINDWPDPCLLPQLSILGVLKKRL